MCSASRDYATAAALGLEILTCQDPLQPVASPFIDHKTLSVLHKHYNRAPTSYYHSSKMGEASPHWRTSPHWKLCAESNTPPG